MILIHILTQFLSQRNPTQVDPTPLPSPNKAPINTHPLLPPNFLTQSSPSMAKISTPKTLTLVLLLNLLLPSQSETVHDILPRYGLPRGLLPSAVVSYSLSSNGEFVVELASACYVHFSSNLVYYDKKITGKVSYGQITDITGIQAKKLFLWASVTQIAAHPADETIDFFVGFLSETLPASEFEEVPACKSRVGGCRGVGGVLKVEALAVAEV